MPTIIDIPKEVDIQVDVESDDKTYKGTFVVRRLSIVDRASIPAIKLELSGGYRYDPDNTDKGLTPVEELLFTAIAHLRVVIVKSPDWWDLDTLDDITLLLGVYEEVDKAQNYFRSGRKDSSNTTGGSVSVSKKPSAAEDEEADSAPDLTEVVGEEVQSSLNP